MARNRDGLLLVEVRKAINVVWEECAIIGFVGRCWGRKHHSVFPGSNIVLCDGKDIVVIYQENASGPVRVHVFKSQDSDNSLYNKIAQILISHNLIELSGSSC